MKNFDVIKRFYNQYTKRHLKKIFIAVFFSVMVAGSTSSIAWLLDPAIEKLFINKDQTLIYLIPIFIVVAFATKGLSLYTAKVLLINVAEEVKKSIQSDMIKAFSLINVAVTTYVMIPFCLATIVEVLDGKYPAYVGYVAAVSWFIINFAGMATGGNAWTMGIKAGRKALVS